MFTEPIVIHSNHHNISRRRMTTQTKTPKKVSTLPTHPSFREMVVSVMKSLKAKSKDRKGQSLRTIVQEISAKYKVNPNNYETQTKLCLKRLLVDGTLEKVKGVGLGGSFKLGSSSQTETSKKKTQPKTPPSKPTAKKATTVTTRKPAAAKKPIASAKKVTGKKPSPKKPSPAKPKAKDTSKKTARTSKPETKPAAKVKKPPGRKPKTPKKAAAKKS